MLLIGDIHITTKYKDKILDSITAFVNKFPEEKNIVFFGDYVYHFSYDRRAIIGLFDLFLKLFHEGKNIYVMAGNHDYISETFVFEEAKRSFDILNQHFENKIYFLTKDFLTNIEGEDVLFLPFNYDYIFENNSGSGGLFDQKTFDSLLNSKNKNENLSGKVNSILENYTKNISKKLFVFHHFYFAGIQFPGQFARFTYKDVALSDSFLDNKNLYFVSGHLHKGFVHKNYLCTGSVYNTSPIEQNDFKCLYKIDLSSLEVKAFHNYINPYISIEKKSDVCISKKSLEENIKQYYEQAINNYSKGGYKVEFDTFEYPNLSDVSLIIKSKEVDYDNIKECFEDNLLQSLKDVRLKKQLSQQNVLEKLDLSNKDLQENIADWKALLKDFISNKFENPDKYLQKLKELKII